MVSKPKLMMHACCANCSLHPYMLLRTQYDMTLYYFNPNIHPRQEYRKRLQDVRSVCQTYRIPLIVGQYQKAKWSKATAGLEEEPEGAKRCMVCFHLRMLETARMAKKMGFEQFCTTLSISPHKDAQTVNLAGNKAAAFFGIRFLAKNFKKDDGFKKTMQLSKQWNLYRQNYCGCTFSRT